MVQFSQEGVFDAESCCWAVQWCPDRASVFGSCAEDGLLNVWDFEKASNSLFSVFFVPYTKSTVSGRSCTKEHL